MDGPGRWRRGSWPRSALSGEGSSAAGQRADDVSPSGDEIFREMPSQLPETVESTAQLVELQQGPLDHKGMESQLRRMHKHVTLLTGELSVLHSEVQRFRVLLSSAIQAPVPRELASLAAIAALPTAATAEELVESCCEGQRDCLEAFARLHGTIAAIEDGCGDTLHGLGNQLQKLVHDATDSARDRAEILGRLDALSQVVTSFEQLLLREVDERTSGDKCLWHALNNHTHTTHTVKVQAPEDSIWRHCWTRSPALLPVTASSPLSPSSPRLATPLASPLLRSLQSTPT